MSAIPLSDGRSTNSDTASATSSADDEDVRPQSLEAGVARNDPDHRELINLKYNDNGTEREMQVPKGDVLHQFRDDVKKRPRERVSSTRDAPQDAGRFFFCPRILSTHALGAMHSHISVRHSVRDVTVRVSCVP